MQVVSTPPSCFSRLCFFLNKFLNDFWSRRCWLAERGKSWTLIVLRKGTILFPGPSGSFWSGACSLSANRVSYRTFFAWRVHVWLEDGGDCFFLLVERLRVFNLCFTLARVERAAGGLLLTSTSMESVSSRQVCAHFGRNNEIAFLKGGSGSVLFFCWGGASSCRQQDGRRGCSDLRRGCRSRSYSVRTTWKGAIQWGTLVVSRSVLFCYFYHFEDRCACGACTTAASLGCGM